jgi:hypothetical protein
MSKLLLTPILLVFALNASPQAHEGSTRYDGKDRADIVLLIPYPSDVVENAINEKLAREGFKGTTTRGWNIFRNVQIKSVAEQSLDLYVKVDRKSRQEKDVSEVMVMVSLGYSNFVEAGNSILRSAGDYIAGVEPRAAAIYLDLNIKSQEDILKKSQKKLDDLVSDSLDLERKKKKLEDNLVDNSRKQGQQRDDITKQQSILEQLRGRRKAE